MTVRVGTRRLFVAVALLAALAQAGTPASGQDQGSDAPIEVGSPVRVVPLGSARVTVDGRPYRGVLEVSRGESGLEVVNVVGVEDYVKGVQEMPPDWPRAALEAQAIAARTLAARAADERSDGTIDDAGAGVPTYTGVDAESPSWTEAVDATRGRVLHFGGRPAAAHFHALAGGRTLSGGPAEPYLPEVDVSAAESGFPLFRWTTRIGAGALADALVAGGVMVRGRVAEVTTERSAASQTIVVVRTDTGDVARIPVGTFVSAVDTGAPDRFPDAFPPPLEPSSEALDLESLGPGDFPVPEVSEPGRRPATLPSTMFDVRQEGEDFVFDGRGWGNGYGMSKIAAKDFADAGGTAADILSRFYEGTTPVVRDQPDETRVRIVSGSQDLRIGADGGFFEIEQERGEPVVAAAADPWRVQPGRDRGLRLVGPPGFGGPLTIADFSVPLRAVENRRLPVEFTLSETAEVTVHLDGPLEGEYRNDVRELGILPGGQLQQVAIEEMPAGTYRVSVEARVGERSTTSESLTVDVGAARRGPTLLSAAGLLAVCAVLLVGAFHSRGRRRERRLSRR